MKNMRFLVLIFAMAQSVLCFGQESEFLEYTTDKYLYNKFVDTSNQSVLSKFFFGKYEDNVDVQDQTSTHSFNTGITRVKTTKEIKDGVIVVTIETWTSKNPSYLTMTNASIVITFAALTAGSVMGIDVLMALQNPNHPNHEYYVKRFSELKGKPLPENYFAEKHGQQHGKVVNDYVSGWFAYTQGFLNRVSGY